MMESEAMSLAISRVPIGTQPAVSLHQRSPADGVIRTIVICAMPSAIEMHTTR
jgi:hypothetical protein